jgi:hypothetical protein
VGFRAAVFRHGEGHRLELSGENLMVGVDQLDLHFVLAGRQASTVPAATTASVLISFIMAIRSYRFDFIDSEDVRCEA